MTLRLSAVLVPVAVALGAMVVFAPKLAVAAVALMVPISVLVRKPDLPVAAATGFFLVVLTPELAAVRPVFPVWGASIYIPHILMLFVAPYVDWAQMTQRFRRLLTGYVGIVVAMALWGVYNGASMTAVLQDSRGPLTFVGGVISAMVLYDRRGLGFMVRLAPVVLGLSVALIGAQLVTGREILGGRVRGAVGFGGVGRAGNLIDATRFIVSSEDLAVASLLVVFWWMIQPSRLRPAWRDTLFVILSSSLLVVLSLSRQLLVGLAVGAVGWLLGGGFAKVSRMAGVAVPLIAAGAMVVSLMTIGGVGAGSETVVGRQIDGFTERVLDGLTPDTIGQDAGSAWRQRENRYAIETITSQPFGTGFGRPYRPTFEVESFGDPVFYRRWVHNVFLWYGTKGGILGLVAVSLVTLVPFLTALNSSRRRGRPDDPVAEISVPVLFAFGVMSLVDPVIINSNSGVLTATLFVLLGLRIRPTFPVADAALHEGRVPTREPAQMWRGFA